MDENQLDMHSVTDLVIEGTDKGLQGLNGATENERNTAYAEQICEVLSSSDLVYTGLWGAINTIYQPRIEGKTYEKIAVKLMNIEDNRDLDNLVYMASSTPKEEVKKVLEDKGLFFTAIHPEAINKEELSIKELELIYLAREHKIFEQLYGGFILPALFVCYEPKKEPGRVRAAMVQNYIKDIRYIGEDRTEIEHTNWDTLSENEVHNLSNFADKLETVFLETGYYPDEQMLENRNLGLMTDGRVILLDTNLIRRIADESERKKLMESATKYEFAIGPCRPIKFLRERIALWNEQH